MTHLGGNFQYYVDEARTGIYPPALGLAPGLTVEPGIG